MTILFAVHGVGFLGGRGPWKKAVGRVLRPHFEWTPIEYGEYRWFGLFSVVFEPWVLVIGITAVGGSGFLGHHKFWWLWLILTVLLSLLLRPFRLRFAFRKFRKQSSLSSPRQTPHIIAHSMGTYLLGKSLPLSDIRLSRVILAGCVLPNDYPWQQIRNQNEFAFQHVRNDIGKADLVPGLAKLAARLNLLHGSGPSGHDGFDVVDGLIHTVAGPNIPCPTCDGIVAPVHNIVTPYSHSEMLTEAYAAAFWLPWLWGIEPWEYQKWTQVCLVARAHLRDMNWLRLRIAEEEMLHFEWKWIKVLLPKELANGDGGDPTLNGYIPVVVKAHPKGHNVSGVVAQVLSEVYIGFERACMAQREHPRGWRGTIRALNPEFAVLDAVDRVLQCRESQARYLPTR